MYIINRNRAIGAFTTMAGLIWQAIPEMQHRIARKTLGGLALDLENYARALEQRERRNWADDLQWLDARLKLTGCVGLTEYASVAGSPAVREQYSIILSAFGGEIATPAQQADQTKAQHGEDTNQ